MTTWDWQPGGFEPITQLERTVSPDTQAEVDRRFYAIVTDLAGTPSELVSPDGTVAWRADRTTWGSVTATASAGASTPLRFPGQYHDPETGFDYNYFRYYEPGVGRYASNDLIGLMGGLNPQSYVPNPVQQSDPLGLMGKKGKGGGKNTGGGGNSGGGGAGSCHDSLVRYMSDAEKQAMENAGGLVPKGKNPGTVTLDTKDKQDNFYDLSDNAGDGKMKWLMTAKQAQDAPTSFGKAGNYTWRADIKMKPNADGVSNHDWLNNWDNAARKQNEPNRYGILPQQLDSFNSRIDSITWTKVGKK
jgi:RHS repeat-associated protein